MRLIDADALPRHGQRGGIVHWKDIDNAPTIDACPYYHHEPTGEPFCEKDDRRHGEWADVNADGSAWECSICHEVFCCSDNYCPNCGAKMDGGNEDE